VTPLKEFREKIVFRPHADCYLMDANFEKKTENLTKQSFENEQIAALGTP
jgi:hypothetical protein